MTTVLRPTVLILLFPLATTIYQTAHRKFDHPETPTPPFLMLRGCQSSACVTQTKVHSIFLFIKANKLFISCITVFQY